MCLYVLPGVKNWSLLRYEPGSNCGKINVLTVLEFQIDNDKYDSPFLLLPGEIIYKLHQHAQRERRMQDLERDVAQKGCACTGKAKQPMRDHQVVWINNLTSGQMLVISKCFFHLNIHLVPSILTWFFSRVLTWRQCSSASNSECLFYPYAAEKRTKFCCHFDSWLSSHSVMIS